MKSKKILSLALVAAIILSMQTNAFAAAVSESDVVPDAVPDGGIAVVQEPEAAEQPGDTQVADETTSASQNDGESTEVAAIQEAFDDSAEIAAYSEDTADEAVEAESENIVSGTCGENLTWTLDKDTGVLTISGDGDMADYSLSNDSPWYNIKEVKFDGNVTSIGDYAFFDCYNLTSVTIPDSVTSIGDGAFHYCSSLPSITIPDSVTSIGDMAFYDCRSLTSVTIPDSVTSIGDYAFSGCSNLTSVTIGNSVTSIGNGAFYNCSNLPSITIPNSVTSIGYSAFFGCSSLTSATLPASGVSIGTGNELLRIAAGETISGECGENLTYTFDSSGVLTISGDGDMEDYSWSSSSIPWYGYTSAIKEVKFDGNVTYIGDYAFSHCSNLPSITIPNSVTSIGDSAFWECYGLTSATIPDSVTSIGDSAFYHCRSLTSVTIPDSVTSIGDGAFHYCSSLPSITIPDSVTSIGEDAFEYCSNLTSVTIPDSVTSIGDGAFHYCSSLPSITIPDSVTSIGDWAFSYCSSLPSITIPDSVTYIGNSAFSGCYILTSIDVSSGNESYVSRDGVLFSNDFSSLICYPGGKSGDYIIPDGVTSIGNYAFYWCYSLTSITIPDSVTSIGEDAFEYCSNLTSATLPASGISIGTGNGLLRIAAGETISGECGENLTWSLNTETGVLTISGNGDMEDYYWANIPWYDYRSAIKEVKFDGNITSIGDSAFLYCINLTRVTIPNSITSIGYSAFFYCSSLPSITIPDSVTSIGYSAFSGCSGLTSATLPASGVSIDGENEALRIAAGEIFSGECGDNLTYTFDSSGVLTISGDGDMWDFEYEKQQSPWWYFSNLIKKVEFNGNITSIGNYAFDARFGDEWYYNNLTSITIPNSVTSIGDYAFFGCGSLTSASIPDTGISIGNGNEALRIAAGEIFSGECGDNLTYTFDVSHVLTISGDGDMWDFDEDSASPWQDFRNLIYKVEFDGNVTSIGEYAFYANDVDVWSTDRLASIIIPKSVTSISSSTFLGCGSLTDVYYTGSEEDWKKIQNKAWSSYSDLRQELVTIHYNYVPESDAPEVGDANGDGVINGKDSTLLMQYLAEWDVDIDESAADVNKDGVVNGKDSTLLMQYLAEWDVTLG